jgi:hypothetical protein
MRRVAEKVPGAELQMGDDLATVSIDTRFGVSGETLITLVREDGTWKVDGSR